MRHDVWVAGRATNALRQFRWAGPALTGSVVALLLIGAMLIAVGMVLGLINPRDVGYPDSSILLTIREVAHSGHIYPEINRPPYQVTVYGPLLYLLLAIPYGLAQSVGIAPQTLVRLVIAGALCICILLIFVIGRRLYGSRPIALLSVLFALSTLPLAYWTTQIRPDFLALGCALLSVYLFLLTNGRPPAASSAICAGIALLIKQTFVAAPISIVGWLIYRRRYKEAFLWAVCFAVTVAGGYALVGWREPLMLENITALRRPIFEYRQALDILANAVSQPVSLFAALGALAILWKRTPEGLLFLIYCATAWLVALLTIPQAGGGINYFWEPLLASAVFAGPGFDELRRKTNQTPPLVTALLLLLLLRAFLPILHDDIGALRQRYWEASTYAARKAKWESFVSVVSGRRLLSTFPDVTIHSRIPEIPDPYLNNMLKLRGRWNSGPVVDEIDRGVFDLIVIGPNDKVGWRGLRAWDDAMWGALKTKYRFACVFDRMEVWLPRQRAGEILPSLSAIGCEAPATHTLLEDDPALNR